MHNHGNRHPPPPRQDENPLTSTPQTQQTAPDTTRIPDPIAQRSTTPHATPASQTTGATNPGTDPEQDNPAPTPADPPAQSGATDTSTTTGTPAAPTTPLAQAAPLGHNTPPNNGTGPQNQDDDTDDNTIGPQANTCTPTGPQTWGPPANDTQVNQVPDRDPSTVQWDISSDCTLTIHHGTTPNYNWYDIPWRSYHSQITKIHIDGNLTLHTTNPANDSGAFRRMGALREVRIDGTLHLSQQAAFYLFEGDSALTAFTGRGTTAIETSQTTNMSQMFSQCGSLTSLDVTHFNTTNTTDMGLMFWGCSGLTALDVTHFNTTNTTNMQSMFHGCSGLTTLDVTHFNTTNTTNMQSMFHGCSGLTALDVTHFNTTNTTNMTSMFWGCSGLTALDVTNFNTTKTTYMTSMFSGCSGLTALDVTNFNTTKTTYMTSMFSGCSGLTTLDVTNFNTTNTTYMGSMFSGCLKLRELWLGPRTYLTDKRGDFTGGLSNNGWVELTASGGPTPVPSMQVRTKRGSNPAGHYIRASLIVTVDYNNGQTDHVQTLNLDTSTNGSQRITWGTRPAPAGKVFDGWDFTTSDPTHVTLDGSTVRWYTGLRYNVGTASLTAKWRTLGTPTFNLKVHADGTNNPDGGPGPWAEVRVTMPTSAANGDGIRVESLNGTGRTANCTPATGTRTCTFNLAIAQLRDASDYDATYRLKASVSARDIRTDPAGTAYGTPAEQQGILPYTTVNYLAGTGTGTPPPSAKALTDTDSRTARITVAGPSPITRPAHSLFTAWQPGSIRPGPATIATSTGTTDAQGRTTVTLTAQWTPLTAPGIGTVTRDPATNRVVISGTAKPNSRADTIRLCHPYGRGTLCEYIITDTTDANGNRLPYDGTTEHPWHTTLSPSTPEDDWNVDATLTTEDPAYPAGNQQVDSPTTRGNIHIPAPYIYMSTLPLTGGDNRHDLLLTAGALAAAMLLTAAATQLRNRRRRQACHRNTATAKTGGQ